MADVKKEEGWDYSPIKIGLAGIAVLVLLNHFIYGESIPFTSPTPVVPIAHVETSVKTGPHEITLYAEEESEAFSLVDDYGNLYKITYICLLDDNVGYVIHHDGGLQNGGFDQPFPAYNTRPPGWQSKGRGKGTREFSMRLEPGSPPTTVRFIIARE